MEISTCLSINRASGTGGVGIAIGTPNLWPRSKQKPLSLITLYILSLPRNLPACLQVYLRTYVLHIYRIFEGTFKVCTDIRKTYTQCVVIYFQGAFIFSWTCILWTWLLCSSATQCAEKVATFGSTCSWF